MNQWKEKLMLEKEEVIAARMFLKARGDEFHFLTFYVLKNGYKHLKNGKIKRTVQYESNPSLSFLQSLSHFTNELKGTGCVSQHRNLCANAHIDTKRGTLKYGFILYYNLCT